jgi:hypothetical protein
MRSQLEEAVFQIRFPIKLIDKFAHVVSLCGSLTKEAMCMFRSIMQLNGRILWEHANMNKDLELPLMLGILKVPSNIEEPANMVIHCE